MSNVPALLSARLYNQHDAFLWMLKSHYEKYKANPTAINGLLKVLVNYWKQAFPNNPFPSSGGTLQHIKIAIQYQLVYDAYCAAEVEPSKRFIHNWKEAIAFNDVAFLPKESTLAKCEDLSEMALVHINNLPSADWDGCSTHQQEAPMATKKKVAAPKAGTVTKAPNASIERKTMAANMIVTGKYTGAQIVNEVNTKFKDMIPLFNTSRVHVLLSELNRGVRKGFIKPTKPYRLIPARQPKANKSSAVKPMAVKKAVKKAVK